jgi:hypothetical protein
MGMGIAKVHQESIPQELGDVPVKTLDHFGTHPLICTHHVTPVFGVELRRKPGGIDQVAEHHRELSPFRTRRGSRERYTLKEVLSLQRRLLHWLVRWSSRLRYS